MIAKASLTHFSLVTGGCQGVADRSLACVTETLEIQVFMLCLEQDWEITLCLSGGTLKDASGALLQAWLHLEAQWE